MSQENPNREAGLAELSDAVGATDPGEVTPAAAPATPAVAPARPAARACSIMGSG